MKHFVVCTIVVALVLSFQRSAVAADTDTERHSPCGLIRCRNNSICVTEESQCAKPPCKRVAVCKPVEPQPSSCINKKCPSRMNCVLEQVQCVREPCQPVAVCKPSPESTILPGTCSNSLCGDGYVCKMRTQCKQNQCTPGPYCIPLPSHMNVRF